MTERKKKPAKTVTAVRIVLAALIVIFAGFTVISHAVYHRSDMATAAELLFRVQGTKKKFSDPMECAEYIEQRRSAGEYVLTAKLKSDVSERSVNGSSVYVLSKSEQPEYLVLYLHGGAYINDASASHWSFCDKLVQKANAEVVFPIYPLTPSHIWDETFDLITAVYQEMLESANAPMIIMGDSAGGGLAAAFCEYIDRLGLPRQPVLRRSFHAAKRISVRWNERDFLPRCDGFLHHASESRYHRRAIYRRGHEPRISAVSNPGGGGSNETYSTHSAKSRRLTLTFPARGLYST